jgi:hypothetical protein
VAFLKRGARPNKTLGYFFPSSEILLAMVLQKFFISVTIKSLPVAFL